MMLSLFCKSGDHQYDFAFWDQFHSEIVDKRLHFMLSYLLTILSNLNAFKNKKNTFHLFCYPGKTLQEKVNNCLLVTKWEAL